MSASTSSGRIPQGEVIVDFADGGSYLKSKLEDAVLALEERRLKRDEQVKAQRAMEALKVSEGARPAEETSINGKDVDFVVTQLGCTRTEAESALKAEKGDMVKTLIRLVKPPTRARSVDGGAEIKA